MASQTSLVNCLCSFIDVSPSKSIQNLSHFRCSVDPDNHNGVIIHLEPDILECEVKWALRSITTNKASGGDGIPVELFQILTK